MQMLDYEIQHGIESDVSLAMQAIREYFCQTAAEMSYPSALFKPRLFIDGNRWCALYGDNLQEGVAGFGSSPEEAMTAFNVAWKTKLPEPPKEI